MCTICGHYSEQPLDAQPLYDMLVRMRHRGPDAHGLYLDGRVERSHSLDALRARLGSSRIALGHSRLAIIDRHGVAQPFLSCDGELALIHNGEIYNYQKLRTLLGHRHRLTGQSDSEVLIHLIEDTYDGDLLAAVRRIVGLLDGTYAIAVTDGRSVVVARDRIGKKPIYYLASEGAVRFASEKKALWNGRDEPSRLPPGHLLRLDRGRLRVVEGPPLQLPQIDLTEMNQAVEEYKRDLRAAVRKRLTGLQEARLGVIFSGGVDSVLIAKLLKDEGQTLACYCVGTEDSGDVRCARSVAAALGLDLTVHLLREREVLDLLPRVMESVEESGLLQVEVAIPMYLAAEAAARDGVRVMFSGQGADELFGGYAWYPPLLEEGLLHLHEKLWEDLTRLYEDTLEREDKLTMAHSIELRVPYLDLTLIRTAMRISPALKVEGRDDPLRKRVHRQVAYELGVPLDIAFRVKDPAQSGSGIHALIERAVLGRHAAVDEELAARNLCLDKGSLYRYPSGRGPYGHPAVRAYLEGLAQDIRRRYAHAVPHP